MVTEKKLKPKMMKFLANQQFGGQSKYTCLYIILVWPYFSDDSSNFIYDEYGDITYTKEIGSTSQFAFYKDGKAMRALSPEWKNYVDPC